MYSLIDLFAGTGAFSYAFHQTNQVVTVFANDMLDSSQAIYNANHSEVPFVKKDLQEIDENTLPHCDILTAGFPCQPFSIAGKQLGFDDQRSNVFWKIIKIVQSKNPRILVLENVKNLQSHDNGNTFQVICAELEKCGYFIHSNVINTCKVSPIPQNRERIYIVCFREKRLSDHFHFEFENPPTQPIKQFLQEFIPDKYYYTPSSSIYDTLDSQITKSIDENTIYQYRRYYVRENKSNVCPTLTANMGSGGHNVPLLRDQKGIRKLTPRECFSLQGFPSTYVLPSLSDCKLYSLAGNAVSIPVISQLATQLVHLLMLFETEEV